jgi:hypothetical protein
MNASEYSEKESSVHAYWYSAESRFGVMGIGIDDGESILEQAVEGANLLFKIKKVAQCENLLREIEEWLKCGLVLMPAMRKDIKSSHLITIELKEKEHNAFSGKLYLCITDEILAHLTKPTESLVHIATIHTSNIPIEFVVSKFFLPEDQEENIKPGNVLLLPDTFDREWIVTLNTLCISDHSIIASMQSDRQTIKISTDDMFSELNDHESQKENGNKAVTIKLKNILQLPFGVIYGWSYSEFTLLSKSISTQAIDIIVDGVRKGRGHLLAVSSGYGVYIDKINNSE